jgi:hypothetical protein
MIDINEKDEKKKYPKLSCDFFAFFAVLYAVEYINSLAASFGDIFVAFAAIDGSPSPAHRRDKLPGWRGV